VTSQPADTVSVVIPTYNCAELLPEAIRSAYAQTEAAHEVIVINDGSSDGTEEVLEQLERELPANFRWVTKPNGGEASARNRGVAMATGEFIAFLDQDDIWRPEKLRHQLNAFRREPVLDLVFTAFERTDGVRSELVRVEAWDPRPRSALRQLMIGCCITNSTVMVRRGAFARVPAYDEKMWLGSDWQMWINMVAAGIVSRYLPEPLTEYRWHDGNMSRDAMRIADAALEIFPRLFARDDLPEGTSRLEPWCMARWHMIKAMCAREAGQSAVARANILRAACLHPLSVRPGWLLLWSGGRYVRSSG
jgi:glycosyltransferase involved in cell wall biosynthesis